MQELPYPCYARVYILYWISPSAARIWRHHSSRGFTPNQLMAGPRWPGPRRPLSTQHAPSDEPVTRFLNEWNFTTIAVSGFKFADLGAGYNRINPILSLELLLTLVKYIFVTDKKTLQQLLSKYSYFAASFFPPVIFNSLNNNQNCTRYFAYVIFFSNYNYIFIL